MSRTCRAMKSGPATVDTGRSFLWCCQGLDVTTLCQDLDMHQVDLDQSVGYALKRAQHALHSAMDGELRDYGLSVSQYACLEILAARPRISNADLARDAFVSRQAMHQLLTGLRAAGLVTAAGQGRSQRYALTAEGRTGLRKASSTVAAIEQRMIATLSRAEREERHRQLSNCGPPPGLPNHKTHWGGA